MFNPDKIRRLFEDRKISQAQFIKDTNISKSNLYVWLNNTSIPGADNLEIIADYFNVPMDYFFDRSVDWPNISIGHQVKGNGNKVSGDVTISECRKEIAHLNALIEEKERVINEKERTIQILMNK
ncbi:transcriptional regulator with XRE-family HTH domain [Bacteroides heparinolyticus]|uniref:Transcriptional regulator with XRE-family HTH domain n=1 Tax=Prevotella heparinolytica TaxID=28113 RepID=A0A4R2LKY5_9BACE|nr:helix-turn-helix transcriptional regulator [Bacteroides heparinolyticus]TCO88119.1 transcriptional regulator with XRE-family HTH domain [Bacteroides heparinolyticus]